MNPIFQVDAFTKEKFRGNPAAVCPLNEWPDDKVLQNIASEINLSETAFIVKNEDSYHLRWFTPAREVRLCGHATLASAHVIFKHLNFQENTIKFTTQKAGDLFVSKEDDHYIMDFPADNYEVYNSDYLEYIVDCPIMESYKGADDILIITDSESSVQNCQPDLATIRELPCRAVIISSKGNEKDFVSRVFAPSCGIDEDPVTGSAHTLMTPYWSDKLNKNELHAEQISTRRGELKCEIKGDRVKLTGDAVTVIKGELV